MTCETTGQGKKKLFIIGITTQ